MQQNIPCSDCVYPVTANATIDVVTETIDASEVVLYGETASIECENFTLFALNVDGTNQFEAEPVTCIEQQAWNVATNAWMCVPTCE